MVLCGVLLSLTALAGSAAARSVVNVAEAAWTHAGTDYRTSSNEVEIVLAPQASRIETYLAGGAGTLFYRASYCPASGQPHAAGEEAIALAVSSSVAARAGKDFIFEVVLPAANRDSSAIDAVDVALSVDSGDRESLTVYESAPDTGSFVGRIATRRMPSDPVVDDCALSMKPGDEVAIAALDADDVTVVLSKTAEVLADPIGVVFDSETGEAISGAVVSLVDAATGAPAQVFAEDGVTPWPDTVTTGEPITDGAGRVHEVDAGGFWFPLTALGSYRLVVRPPAPYTAPSVVAPDRLAQLARSGGGLFTIVEASYGRAFTLADPTPVRIDIPLDRPATPVTLAKSVSRESAQPGDALIYTVLLRNSDDRVKTGVVLTDRPASMLRLRRGSVRVEGEPAAEALTVGDDGRTLISSMPRR